MLERSRGPVGALGALGALLVLTVLVAACGSTAPTPTGPSSAPATGSASPTDSETASPSADTTPSAEPTPTPVPTPVLVPAPLTGLLVTPAAAARHPIAVMIDDLSAARPQSGFSYASVVWQAPAEGGIPRYMMIFGENQPAAVGPVRSARYYYIAWAAEWRAVYVHAGGSPQALSTLRAKGGGQLVFNADQFAWGQYFNRITTRFSPHNLYTDGKRLDALAKRRGAKAVKAQPIWRFGPDAPLEQRPVGGRIVVSYPTSTIRYDYDRTTNTYLRTVSVEGKQKDASTKQRVAPKNVVVMLMSFGPLNDGEPYKHRLEAKVIGSGVAWVSTNGVTVKGTWRKQSLTGPTKFYDSHGTEVTLTAGQTFVNVMKAGTPVLVVKGAPAPSAAPSGSPTPTPSPSAVGPARSALLAV